MTTWIVRTFSLVCAFGCLLSTARADAPSSWKSLGLRWAIELNENSKPVSLYDLSYPSFLDRISLGFIYDDSVNWTELKNRILEGAESWNGDSKIAEDALLAIGEAKSPPNASLSKRPFNLSKLPWKSLKPKVQSDGTFRFRLSEIDLDRVSKVHRLSQADLSLLDQLEYEKKADGRFEIHWLPTFDLQSYGWGPKKIADLDSVREGFYQSAALELLENTYNVLSNFIADPMVDAVISTAVSRYFHFYYLMIGCHQDMVLENLASAELDENSHSPFTQLSHEDRTKIGESLIWSQTALAVLWKRAFTPAETEWHDLMNQYGTSTRATQDWLTQRGKNLTPLSPRFDFALESGAQRWIYSSSRSEPRKERGPWPAYDFVDPSSITKNRIYDEFFSLMVNFGTRFIPWGGLPIRMAYKFLVEDVFEKTKRAECRLMTHLEEQAGNSTFWDPILDTLDQQQTNPMEMGRKERNELIRKRRKDLGL